MPVYCLQKSFSQSQFFTSPAFNYQNFCQGFHWPSASWKLFRGSHCSREPEHWPWDLGKVLRVSKAPPQQGCCAWLVQEQAPSPRNRQRVHDPFGKGTPVGRNGKFFRFTPSEGLYSHPSCWASHTQDQTTGKGETGRLNHRNSVTLSQSFGSQENIQFREFPQLPWSSVYDWLIQTSSNDDNLINLHVQEVIFKASLCTLESINTHDTIIIIKPHLALPGIGEECGGG